MAKIKLISSPSIAEIFQDFIVSRRTKGLADKTLQSYQSQFKAISRHLDIEMPIDQLNRGHLDDMIGSMRDSGLSSNSIGSYTRVLKSFFSWCNEEEHTFINIKLYKCEETIKETYSNQELTLLLNKPNIRKCRQNKKISNTLHY